MGRVVRESTRNQLLVDSAIGHASGFCGLAKTPTAQARVDNHPSEVGEGAGAETARRILLR